MKKLYIVPLLGALLLTGVGCENLPPELQTLVDTKTEITTPAEVADEAAAEEKTTKTETPASPGLVVQKPTTKPVPKQPVVKTAPEPADETGDEPESDQEMIQLFEYKPTHSRNYDAYQQWDRYADRASLATVLATPAATEKYEQTEWCPLDKPCTTMFEAGLAANLAMKKADVAFKGKQTNTEQLVNQAVAAVAHYYQTILAFEGAWGVNGNR